MIREYQEADVEDIMEVWSRANAMAHPFLPVAFVTEVEHAIRNVYLGRAETFVQEKDGRVIGFIALLGNEIGGLFVDPSRHGRGHGKALVDHAVALKGPLKVEVFRDNAAGRRFYERFGFEFVADEFHEPSGHVNRRMAMPGA
jgi:putative acetyltransferase